MEDMEKTQFMSFETLKNLNTVRRILGHPRLETKNPLKNIPIYVIGKYF